MSNPFGFPDSDLDAIIEGDKTFTDAPARAAFTEVCPKCRGTGRFIGYTGRVMGECFACKGAGKKEFKSSPADRAVARERSAARKVRSLDQAFEAFKEAFPAEAAWLEATAPRWELAASFLDAARKWGRLTDKQMAVVRNGMVRDADRAAAKVAKVIEAPAVDTAGIDRLKAAFDQAVAFSAEKGLKLSPKLTIDGMTISPAKATSKNPGALYVKERGFDGAYLGKIADGRFHASRDCSDERKAAVLAFVADPAEAAKVYGQTTGTCCICNATLRSEWKNRGIGPICAEKFGW